MYLNIKLYIKHFLETLNILIKQYTHTNKNMLKKLKITIRIKLQTLHFLIKPKQHKNYTR